MPVETEIRLRVENFKGDAARAEGEVNKLKERVQRMDVRLNVVLADKAVRAQMDVLLKDLQAKANAKPITIPVNLVNRGGGSGRGVAPGGSGGGGGGDSGIGEALAGAGAGAALGRTGAMEGLLSGVGKVTAAYAAMRVVTASLETININIERSHARQAGNIEREIELEESLRQKLTEIPVAGKLGSALNDVFFGRVAREGIARVEAETKAQLQIVEILERRNALMRKSIDHAKELTRAAEREAAEKRRPGSGAVTDAQQKFALFEKDLAARVQATGRGPTSEENAARGALMRGVDDAILAQSRKETEEGAEALKKWNEEIFKYNQAVREAINTERERRGRIAGIREATRIAGIRGFGDEAAADFAEKAEAFNEKIREAVGIEEKHALQLLKNATLSALFGKQEEDRINGLIQLAEESKQLAREAGEATLRRSQERRQRERNALGLNAQAEELELRNRGMGNVADVLSIRQRINDIIEDAGEDPAANAGAKRLGAAMLDQFIKGARSQGGIFAGRMEFGRNVQASILSDEGKDRAKAIEMAKAFAAELAKGSNFIGIVKR